MKIKIGITVTLLIIINCMTFAEESEWKNIIHRWDIYCLKPSSKNAQIINNALTNIKDTTFTEHQRQALGNMYNKINILAKRISLCDSEAIKMAFLLYPYIDGSFAEEIDIYLGKVIIKNPYLFLKMLSRYENKVKNINGLLGNLGEEYIDNECKSKKEIKLRIKALTRVRDKKYNNIRHKCLEYLKTKS